MAKDRPTSSYAILALLSVVPMSGYDLWRAAARTIAHISPISKAHVYSELPRLEEAGLVEATEVIQQGRPDKQVYRLTDSGAKRLDDWLRSSELSPTRVRSPFLLRLAMSHRLPPEIVAEQLSEYERDAEAELAHLRELVAVLAANPDAVYGWATALWGVRVAEASLAWAREIQAALPKTALQIDARRVHARKAPALLAALPPPPSRRRRGT